MPTPKGGYRDKDGNRIPGVTTVLGAHKDSGGLVHAAWKLGLDGLHYREEWDKAADIGTCVHARIEAFITGKPFDQSEFPDVVFKRSHLPYKSFLEWARGKTLEGSCEVALVHSRGFGGTIDYLGGVLLDWKTNKAIYPDVIAQVAAYGMLCEEHYGTVPDCIIVRFDKEGGPAEEVSIPAGSAKMEAGRKYFLGLLDAYEAKEELEKK